MDDIYKNIEEYNPNKKRKTLIVSDRVIVDMFSKEKLNPKVTELIIRGRTKYFSCFYHTILFCCIEKYCCIEKFNTLFRYENSKQRRASINYI